MKRKCDSCIHSHVCEEHLHDVWNTFDNCHSYDAERPHGEWIEHRQFLAIGHFFSEYECSNCHDDVWQRTEWQFCPNCGARMTGEGEQK